MASTAAATTTASTISRMGGRRCGLVRGASTGPGDDGIVVRLGGTLSPDDATHARALRFCAVPRERTQARAARRHPTKP
jgi:hypothetical protein